jgi:hypothetical protein
MAGRLQQQQQHRLRPACCVLPVLVAVVALTGCGSAAQDPSQQIPGTPVLTSGSTASPPWDKPMAQTEFQAMIAPVVDDFRTYQAIPSTGPLGTYQTMATQISTDESALATKLRAGLWPAAARAQMAALADAVAAESAVFSQVAAASTVADVHVAEAAGANAHSAVLSATEAAQTALGLTAS